MSNLEYRMNKATDTITPMTRVNKNRIFLNPLCFISYTITVFTFASNETPTAKPVILMRNCISPKLLTVNNEARYNQKTLEIAAEAISEIAIVPKFFSIANFLS